MPNYFGDPYVNCRPECVQSSECPSTKACVNMRCIDPCLGTCGLNSECRVHNHSPYCSCSPGYTGNPSQACRPIVVESKIRSVEPVLSLSLSLSLSVNGTICTNVYYTHLLSRILLFHLLHEPVWFRTFFHL